MKAAVLHKTGGPFSVEEVDLAPPQKGEVRVRLKAAGACHSDWHFVVDELISQRYPLSQINEAYADLLMGGPKRGVLVMG